MVPTLMLERTAFALASLAPRIGPDGSSILCYHGVEPDGAPLDRFAVSTRAFAAHLAAIASCGRTVAPLVDLARRATPAVAITFDDNLLSHVRRALPVLRGAAMTASFFVCPGDLGADGQLSHRDVNALLAAGMHVGAHGFRHRRVRNIEGEAFASDVRRCADFLRALGVPLTWAYPGGHIGSFHPLHERILADQGFAIRLTTHESVVPLGADAGRWGRYVIRNSSSARYVRAAAQGRLQCLGIAKRLRGGLRPSPLGA